MLAPAQEGLYNHLTRFYTQHSHITLFLEQAFTTVCGQPKPVQLLREETPALPASPAFPSPLICAGTRICTTAQRSQPGTVQLEAILTTTTSSFP